MLDYASVLECLAYDDCPGHMRTAFNQEIMEKVFKGEVFTEQEQTELRAA